MGRVGAIVCISSCYAGIFRATNILKGIHEHIAKLAAHVTAFGATALVSIGTSCIACNQTLAIMLTHQLCNDLQANREKLVVTLADTVVVIAPLVPWSIAGAVPLAMLGAPAASVCFAFFLIITPLWGWLVALQARKHVAQQ